MIWMHFPLLPSSSVYTYISHIVAGYHAYRWHGFQDEIHQLSASRYRNKLLIIILVAENLCMFQSNQSFGQNFFSYLTVKTSVVLIAIAGHIYIHYIASSLETVFFSNRDHHCLKSSESLSSSCICICVIAHISSYKNNGVIIDS